MIKPLLLLASLGAMASTNANANTDTNEGLVAAVASQPRYHLMAVIDTRKPDDNGLPVLTVTPGGAAERLGLKAGDRIRAINGVRLDTADATINTLEQGVAARGGKLDIELTRNGQSIRLTGEASIIGIASSAAKGCGYVTDQAGPTPRSENIFPALITSIDGASTPLHSANRHKTAAGSHVLLVTEDIPESRLSSIQLLQISKLKQLAKPRQYSLKALIIDVEPDHSYRVGARLLKDKLDTQSIRNNNYWEPVIWKVVPERCP